MAITSSSPSPWSDDWKACAVPWKLVLMLGGSSSRAARSTAATPCDSEVPGWRSKEIHRGELARVGDRQRADAGRQARQGREGHQRATSVRVRFDARARRSSGTSGGFGLAGGGAAAGGGAPGGADDGETVAAGPAGASVAHPAVQSASRASTPHLIPGPPPVAPRRRGRRPWRRGRRDRSARAVTLWGPAGSRPPPRHSARRAGAG